MKILNLYVYEDSKDQHIKIRLDSIYPIHQSLLRFPVNILQYALTNSDNKVNYQRETLGNKLVLENLISQYVSKPEIDPFNAHKLEDICFKAQDTEFKVASVIYTLPNNPLLILQWVTCLSVFLNKENYSYGYCFFQKNIDHDLPLSMSLEDFYKHSENHKANTLLQLYKELSAFKETAFFKETFQVLDNMLQFYKERRESENPLPFIECMQSRHHDLLWGALTHTLLNPKVDSKTKLQELFKAARALIYTDRTKELNQMLTSINFYAKTKLIQECIGKPSHDERPQGYGWNYTEFPLFLDNKVQFNFTKEGLLCVSGYLETEGYLKNYAKGERNHTILAPEMIYLGDVLGLAFEPGDFHQQMVFTKESTAKLMALGVHYNVDYVKNLFKMQKYSNFFKRHIPDLADVFNTITFVSLEKLDSMDAVIALKLAADEEKEPSCSMQI